jgi:hypothetical protein
MKLVRWVFKDLKLDLLPVESGPCKYVHAATTPVKSEPLDAR